MRFGWLRIPLDLQILIVLNKLMGARIESKNLPLVTVSNKAERDSSSSLLKGGLRCVPCGNHLAVLHGRGHQSLPLSRLALLQMPEGACPEKLPV